jgi:dihydroneopterin aldolase
MYSALATIRITNLRLRTYIGFNEEERAKQQDVVINIEIMHRVQPAAPGARRPDRHGDWKRP